MHLQSLSSTSPDPSNVCGRPSTPCGLAGPRTRAQGGIMPTEHSTIIDQLAGAQHGLVTSPQAVKALGRGRKQRWVTERRMVVIQPGVYRLAGAPQTWH